MKNIELCGFAGKENPHLTYIFQLSLVSVIAPRALSVFIRI